MMDTTARSTLWLGCGLGVLMLYPYPVSLMLAGPGQDHLTVAGNLCILQANLALMISALVLAFEARVIGNVMADRMATMAVVIALQDLPLAVLALNRPEHEGYAYRLTVGHVVAVAIVLVLMLSATRRGSHRPHHSPILLGIVLGMVALVPQLALIDSDVPALLTLRSPFHLTVLAFTIVALAVIAARLLRSSLPAWAARRLGVAMVALFAGRLWATAVEAQSPPPATVLLIVMFSAVLVTTVTGLLRSSLAATDDQIASLIHRTADAEATVRHDREIAHEVRAATAGIVAGAQLLASDRVPPGPRRVALRQMVDAEAARLHRSLSLGPCHPTVEIDLDSLIEPLVVAHGALGHLVHWRRSGHQVIGRTDALAEVLNILLTNADRHARGAGTTLVVSRSGDLVELCITDQGPGLDPSVRDHLFEWGARGSHSTGEGIGLQRAHRLMQEQGGSLTFATTHDLGGASFVVRLPASDALEGAVTEAPATRGAAR